VGTSNNARALRSRRGGFVELVDVDVVDVDGEAVGFGVELDAQL
jgi:hypothetical protein